jgi:hypothetical protein
VFADLKLTKHGKGKPPPPPPETLYNLKEDQSIFTLHHQNEPPPQDSTKAHLRKAGETINMTGLGEDSNSSSSTSLKLPSAAASSKGVVPPAALGDEEDKGSLGMTDAG